MSTANLIWNNLLEPAIGGDAEDRIKQLTCGCLVLRDGDYLDLYILTSAALQCDQQYAHNLILAYRPFADGYCSPGQRRALLNAVKAYTEDWHPTIEREPTLALFTAALEEN